MIEPDSKGHAQPIRTAPRRVFLLLVRGGLGFLLARRSLPRVTISENFASHAAVQELVDVKPDRTSPEIL